MVLAYRLCPSPLLSEPVSKSFDTSVVAVLQHFLLILSVS